MSRRVNGALEPAPYHQLADEAGPPPDAFWVMADDGIRLRLALWHADSPRGTILLFPGRTEYVEKYAPSADRLNAEGYNVLAIDWRGQGLSDRLQENTRLGHVGDFADYQRDVVEMVLAASELDLPKPWHLLSHSMGGCIALGALYNELPIEVAVFSAPMWGINLRRFPNRLATGLAGLAQRLGRGGHPTPGSGSAGSYILDESFSANLLTGNADEWTRLVRQAVAFPDLTIGGVSYDWLRHALAECARLSAMPAPDYPCLISVGADEKIVSHQAIKKRATDWPGAELLLLDDCRHEVMMETPVPRDQFFDAMLDHFARR